MNYQEDYRERYRKIKCNWEDSLTKYRAIVEGYTDEKTKILDVGCGHGDFMAPVYSRAGEVFGIDADERALTRNKIIINKVVGRVESLPFPDNFFDLSVSAWVLEHLENPARAFKEIYRTLKPKGKVIFLTPNTRNYNVWLIRLIPEKWHDFFTRKIYDRQEHDTFPKFYRMNSVKEIHEVLTPPGFKKVKLILNGDPTYISFNEILFKLACFVEDILEKYNLDKVHIIGIYEKY